MNSWTGSFTNDRRIFDRPTFVAFLGFVRTPQINGAQGALDPHCARTMGDLAGQDDDLIAFCRLHVLLMNFRLVAAKRRHWGDHRVLVDHLGSLPANFNAFAHARIPRVGFAHGTNVRICGCSRGC